MILAGDIGGTKTHLVLYENAEKLKWIKDKKYRSQDFKSLLEIIKDFLSDIAPKSVSKACFGKACFGIAGPIKNNRCQATNLPWVIDGDEIARAFNIKTVTLINDLTANAYGIRCLLPEEVAVLNEGEPPEHGNIALISAGTGLGEVGLFWDGVDYQPIPSEGGHVDFAPRDELEMELLRYLQMKFGHVSFERVVSGQGIHNLYSFLIDMHLEEESQSLKLALIQGDPARVISEMAMNNESKACVRTLEWFVSLYASAAGNLALKFLSLGGVYIGGGIAPKIMKFMKKKEFMRAFSAKGRFKDLLESIPVKIVLNENTALIGAAIHAKEKN